MRVPGHGPTPARILIIGEVPGREESVSGLPFVGQSGRILDDMLGQVGINTRDVFLTNVFSDYPDEGNTALFMRTRDDLLPGYPETLGPIVTSPSHMYLAPERLWELDRLHVEIARADPYIIVPMGNVASWFALGIPEITKMRGTLYRAELGGKTRKVLPTFHPAYVDRQWRSRPIVCVDLAKALAESATRDIQYDNAELWLNPTLDDLYAFERHIRAGSLLPDPMLAVDVETRQGQITEIGFAPDPFHAINIPFRHVGIVRNKSMIVGNYWPSAYHERIARQWCQRILASPFPKVMQNGMYDTQYLIRELMPPTNFAEDTMLAQHSLYSELPKDLGFLGSVHTNHPSWKYLARRHQDDLKRDA